MKSSLSETKRQRKLVHHLFGLARDLGVYLKRPGTPSDQWTIEAAGSVIFAGSLQDAARWLRSSINTSRLA